MKYYEILFSKEPKETDMDERVSVLAQDTGCNTASLRDFLETLSCLEGKEFQVVTWVAGRKTRGFKLHGTSFYQTRS